MRQALSFNCAIISSPKQNVITLHDQIQESASFRESSFLDQRRETSDPERSENVGFSVELRMPSLQTLG